MKRCCIAETLKALYILWSEKWESGMVLVKRDYPPENGNFDTYDVAYFRSSFVQATPERVDPSEPGLELRTTTEQLGGLQAVVEEPELIRSPEIPLEPASPEHTHQHQLIRCYHRVISPLFVISFPFRSRGWSFFTPLYFAD